MENKKISDKVQRLLDEMKNLTEEEREDFEFETFNDYSFNSGMDSMLENLKTASIMLDDSGLFSAPVNQAAFDALYKFAQDNWDEVCNKADELDEENEECEDVCLDCQEKMKKMD